ncbi:endonuclease/exonuclease/phosphatase family protein [Tamaricihabitans halophyticus]|uniref:Endonuclease/exonuclease/phosphatase family protein n=1 Tax=Tamaricihabitans halophyticus TaxID=1262583 RepID=A0A4R2QQ95_9PSEU|nr:endonuclease/exonuclease/phosphatase family protein [Tamaricihabitans halophyticus]TCP49195.1 endonuclease/exonuclease/phosphatase family protein [Tamaricihabitans halophyticus]
MRGHRIAVVAGAFVLLASLAPAAQASETFASETASGAGGVRFATYNTSLNRAEQGQLAAELATPDNAQASMIAEVLQRTRPDVVLLNEFDYDQSGAALDGFRDNYLARGQHDAAPIEYPYHYTAPVNTGVPSGHDLNNDGVIGGPDDAFGFGEFPGQYGMVVLSKYPIDTDAVRTFQQFRWQDMPGALLPDNPDTPEPADWYSPDALADLRLSSKSHWDVPIKLGKRTVHLLAAHPTPPSFDGPEDRNGKRNHDEIRFWADYVHPARGGYIYDDVGNRGGLPPGARFVIAGDLNADPLDGDSVDAAANQVLRAHRVIDPRPRSAGGPEASELQGGANETHRGDPGLDTADFSDEEPGNLRVDYVLPSLPLLPKRAGVFWPRAEDELARLTEASDHRLVWTDLLVT